MEIKTRFDEQKELKAIIVTIVRNLFVAVVGGFIGADIAYWLMNR